MTDIKGLIKEIEDYNKRFGITGNLSDADRLIERIQRKAKSKEECFALEKEVADFLKSDITEEDIGKVLGYTEPLYMICSAIREKRDNVP